MAAALQIHAHGDFGGRHHGLAGGFGTVVLGNLTGPTRALGGAVDVNVGATGIGANSALLGKLGNNLVNTTDANGRRYCFARQPEIARWNLERLADALAVITADPNELTLGLMRFDEIYTQEFRDSFAAKFGLGTWCDEDVALVEDAFDLLRRAEVDMTLFFRKLAEVDAEDPKLSVLAGAFYQTALFSAHASEFSA